MSKKISKSLREHHTLAKKELSLVLKVGNRTFRFPAGIFDLDNLNIALLSDQIALIPATIAYAGVALAEAEREQARTKVRYDIWMAEKMALFEGLKATERFKVEQVRYAHTDAYKKHMEGMQNADYTVRLCKSYMSALQAKHELAQTISANLRREHDAYGAGTSA